MCKKIKAYQEQKMFLLISFFLSINPSILAYIYLLKQMWCRKR